MVRKQKGFTLIELVMVIVILGILAAVAIPKYIDMREEALDATLNGLCGGLRSSGAILIMSSYGTGNERGKLKPVADVVANTELGTATTTGATPGAISIVYQGSTRACDLSTVAR